MSDETAHAAEESDKPYIDYKKLEAPPEPIALYYHAEKNERDGTLTGIALADITESQYAALTDAEKVSVAKAGFWMKSKPRKPKDDAGQPDAQADGGTQ